MIPFIIVALILLAAWSLVSWNREKAVLGEVKVYTMTSPVRVLDIRLNAADFTIEHGDTFCVESNLKELSVSEKNGVLTVVDELKYSADYSEAVLKLRVPRNTVFEQVRMVTGAAKLTANALSTDYLSMKLGAGKVRFGCLNAFSGAEVDGGAGDLSIASGTLKDLKLRLGVGKLDMTAALLGESELCFGVGDSNLTLLGGQGAYRLDTAKGIGTIRVNGYTGTGFSGAYPQNHVKVNGGIGAANITFREK